MNYTVKKLAKLSGVSVRTLHFYDEIGLLKPAYISDNGYRYYKEPQLLLLQQILFFRELGLELKQIQEILNQTDFDKIDALQSHKKVLQEKIFRMKELLKTIDKTIDHLEGQQPITEEEMYHGFSKEKQAEYEQYLIEKLGSQRCALAQSKMNIKNWTRTDWKKHKATFDEIHKALTQAILKGHRVDSDEVQKLIDKHYRHIKLFWTPTRESYIGLGQSYTEHPDFRKMYASYHPELAHFLADAMKLYAERNLG
ncbi:MAG: MerR family transcriptional regulator [Tatlockia sp.]|nr:MerR family transcriptional regulator [Tatlockia sp.]